MTFREPTTVAERLSRFTSLPGPVVLVTGGQYERDHEGQGVTKYHLPPVTSHHSGAARLQSGLSGIGWEVAGRGRGLSRIMAGTSCLSRIKRCGITSAGFKGSELYCRK